MAHETLSERESPHTLPSEKPTLDWQRAHEELSQLARTRARLDWQEGGSLLYALRSGAHLHLGFGSFAQYIERLFGYKSRWTEERLRVAEALEGLPELGQALRDGAMSWSAVRELTRVATPENERAWLEVARGRTMRQIEELVAGHRPGDTPDEPYDPSLRRHVLRFEVSADTLATFREAMARLRRDAGSPLDDDASLLLVARQILGGPTERGRANYQIALTVCEKCGRGWQQGSGELVEVDSEIIEMAGCDAQHLGRIDFPPSHPVACESVAPPQASACEQTDSLSVADAGRHPSATHVGGRSARARQDVPPAVRRQVMRRDRGGCVVPGCRHVNFLDLHHIKLRSEGGDHGLDNLVTLCGAHHRALHRGQLNIEGRVSTGLIFRYADGTKYGSAVSPHSVAKYEQAFLALRSLGFREGEARKALDHTRANACMGDANVETILRQALASLAPSREARMPPMN